MKTIKKQLTIAEYAQSLGAKACSLITNGPKNNWLSFNDANGLKIGSLATGDQSQNADTVGQFSILVFEDDSMVATANSYITADTVSFA